MADITIVVEESVAVAVDAETNTALIVEVPEQGPAGPTGPTGPTGPSGADGATWYTDAGVPSGALGEVGDMYLNYSNGDIYEKTGASTWTARMNVATGYTRLHDMTSTDDHSAGNYKIFYSDGSGHVQELVHGTANKVLTSNGATSAPSWEDAGTTSPLTTKGDVYTYDTDNARLPVGSNGQVLTADSGETTGLKWAAAGTSSPLTTKGDLYTYSTDNARLPVGTDGYVLKADSGEATGLIWAAESGGTGDKIEEGNSSVEVVDTGTGYVSITTDGTERLRVDADGIDVTGSITHDMAKVYAYRSSYQTISTGTFTTVVYDNEVIDTGSNYNTSTGEFTAPAAGFYQVSGCITYDDLNGGDAYFFIIFVNGIRTYDLTMAYVGTTDTSKDGGASGSATIHLDASDVVTFRTWHDKGSDARIHDDNYRCWTTIYQLDKD